MEMFNEQMYRDERYNEVRNIIELDRIPIDKIVKISYRKCFDKIRRVLKFSEEPVIINGILYEIPDGFMKAVQQYIHEFKRPDFFILKKVESVRGIEYEIEEVM